jgi:type I restriction enzyme S subunit
MAMSELPSSWAWAPLSAITTDVPQRVPEPNEQFVYIDIGSIDRFTKSIVSPQSLLGKDAPSRARKQVAAGDTLVSMTRPNLNAVALVPSLLDGEIASTGFDVLRPVGIDPRWTYNLVRTEAFVEAMSSLVQGALYPAVRSKDVRAHRVPVAPAPEQTRIADELDILLARANACNDRLDAIPGLIKRLRQAVLQAATSGELTFDWRSVKRGGSMQGWTSTTVASLTTVVRGASPRPAGDPRYFGGATCPWITVGEITKDEEKYLNRTATCLTEEGRARSRFIEPDTLLLTNSGATLGVPKITRIGGCINDGSVALLGLAEPTKSYLYWHLKSLTQELRSINQGAAQPNLNTGIVKSIEVSLPDTEEQAEIVRRVESLFALADCIEARYTAARAHAERLAPRLLAKAFRGELVSQDPNDEPANALLARIAAERASTAPGTKARQPRTPRAARAPKETAHMTKSRQDDDVKGHPYLAGHLRRLGRAATAEELFKAAELPVADFYKQLAWEVAKGHVKDGRTVLEAGDAA